MIMEIIAVERAALYVALTSTMRLRLRNVAMRKAPSAPSADASVGVATPI